MNIPLSLHPQHKILCVGLNYRDHAAEGKQDVPEHPVFFIRYASSFVKHGEPLEMPRHSGKYDYEGELVVIIGKTGRDILESEALGYVQGYTIGMDGSVRDYQKRTPQWTLGKNFDRSGALGPHITSASQLPPGASGLRITTRVNGEVLQDDSTANMIFPVARLIASASEAMTLNPGDMILTGTPAGVGFARKPPIYLKPGDEVSVTIDGIGELKNRVA
jgi:2-keto-4-pentenoate hydratase/2-oxohepta-3-ene-1,7-dioic acid hydratase in catechol pathway